MPVIDFSYFYAVGKPIHQTDKLGNLVIAITVYRFLAFIRIFFT